jgi:hypothetical protein
MSMNNPNGYDAALKPDEYLHMNKREEDAIIIAKAVKDGVKLNGDEYIPGIPKMFSTHGMTIEGCEEKSKEVGTINVLDYVKG